LARGVVERLALLGPHCHPELDSGSVENDHGFIFAPEAIDPTVRTHQHHAASPDTATPGIDPESSSG
jgi:hypothetical protein